MTQNEGRSDHPASIPFQQAKEELSRRPRKAKGDTHKAALRMSARSCSFGASAAYRRETGHHNAYTAEVDYTAEELRYLRLMDEWKARTGKSFPTLTDGFRVMLGMGYVCVPHGFRIVPAVQADALTAV